MAEITEQNKAKQTIDETIDSFLSGENRELAREFVAFLRENKMSPQLGAKNSYNLSYKSRRVCIIKFFPDVFELRLHTQYNDDFNAAFAAEGAEEKSFLIDTAPTCFGCGTCMPGIDMTLLGAPKKGLCYNPIMIMQNPDARWLKLAKKLVLLRKQAIADGKAPKVTYIAISKR